MELLGFFRLADVFLLHFKKKKKTTSRRCGAVVGVVSPGEVIGDGTCLHCRPVDADKAVDSTLLLPVTA